jgi:hypothetical protein
MRRALSPRTARVAAALVAVGALVPAAAGAQQGGVFGTVVDVATEEPLVGVRVAALDMEGREQVAAYSDDEGDFNLKLPADGGWMLVAELIGYALARSDTVQAGPHDQVIVRIRLTVEPVRIDEPIVVTAISRVNPDLRAFYDRMERGHQSGFGRFVSREDIDRIRPIDPTDLLRMTSGVRVVEGGYGRGRGLRMAGGTCTPAVFIDGVQINHFDNRDSIDDFLAVQAIEGIEVYRGAQQVGRFFDREGCGMVLVWTRRGHPDPDGRRGLLRIIAGAAVFGLILLLR